MDWIHNFFQIGPIPQNTMGGTYNLYIVFLSYVIASFASFVALDMSAHLRRPATAFFRISWLIGGSLIMGAGIWSMHFIGMLAFEMHMPMAYETFWTVVSMLVAIFTATIAFFLFSIKNPGKRTYLVSGVVLGIAIPTMHYTGMAGMVGVRIHYLPIPFALSIATAVVAAIAAVWLSVKSDAGSLKRKIYLRLVSGLIMGLGISGMHYIGMYAAIFTPAKTTLGSYFLDDEFLIVAISATVLFITLVGFLLSTTKSLINQVTEKEKVFLESILINMEAAVIATDMSGNITLLNPVAKKLFEIDNKDEVNYLLCDMKKNPLEPEKYPLKRALMGEDITAEEFILKKRDGRMQYLLVYGQPLLSKDSENLGAVSIFHDISKLKKSEEELAYRATHDALTNLPNRNLLLDRLEHSLAIANREHKKIALFFLDLDNFKYINDSLGHPTGDALLIELAKRLLSALRSVDTIARIGGDEFVILIESYYHDDDLVTLLEKILLLVEKPFFIHDHELNITTSIGVALYPTNDNTSEGLLKKADSAMYHAKLSGRNNFQFYNSSMKIRIDQRLKIEADLRKAILRKEFFLVYQPKLDIQNNRLVGYEALIRWNHPEKGVILPEEFIPIAELTGMIIPIGKWVLKEACKQNKQWCDSGLGEFSISVNLSAKQCDDDNLMAYITKILDETDLKPELLELELTETVAMSNPKKFIDMLQKCHALGIKTSIDDFGTGYSSLNYLRQFPVNNLKIDKTFIAEDIDSSPIVKSIVALGHSLNLKVIAEGVESKRQIDQLKQNLCDEIQGYYFSQPISAADLAEFIKKFNGQN